MVGAGIEDGDYVLLMDDDIPDGGIGAVLYDGETSLKRIFYDKNGLRLEPANDEYSDIYIRPDVFEEVRILGRYAGRSEEHTSELQSRGHLVCRLLPEKKHHTLE